MVSSIAIFLDSNVLIAFANEQDALHDRAVALMQRISGAEFFISDYVFNEVVTVLAMKRRARERAIRFGKHLLNSDIVILRIMKPILDEGWEVFCKEKNLSFTDATIIATMRQFDIPTLATFDEDFQGMKGITVVDS